MSLPLGTRLGPYEIVAPIGAGGMGEVYRARDTRLGREVAIKVLPAEVANDPERLARFEREAKAVSALNHPHIVTLHEVGTSDAGPYLVLEKIEGQSLRELLKAGPLPIRRILGLGVQIADGLAKAHEAGIVHRDLKPENVMVTADGFAKILDFGLAKLRPELDPDAIEAGTTLEKTVSGLILGTLGYLSPEQASGKPADYRADQFALGALLYEMAAGARPFRRDTVLESLTATIREEPEPLRAKRPDLPPPLGWLVERCLAKDPDDRYTSTKDLARDLADLRDHLSDLIRAPSGEAAPITASARSRERLRWVLVSIALAAVAVGSFVAARQTDRLSPPSYRPLTFRRGIITGARFGPDGKTVYYSVAYGAEPSRVFVTHLERTESEPVNVPPGILLSVSSRDELAVLLTTYRNPANSLGTLVRVPALGGTPRALIEDTSDADWAPDGERLAVIRGDDARLEFPIGHSVAPDINMARLHRGDRMARVSPRGDRIAVTYGDSVGIYDLMGKRLVSEKAVVFGAAWSPDGREVWYTGSESGGAYDRALYALSLTGQSASHRARAGCDDGFGCRPGRPQRADRHRRGLGGNQRCACGRESRAAARPPRTIHDCRPVGRWEMGTRARGSGGRGRHVSPVYGWRADDPSRKRYSERPVSRRRVGAGASSWKAVAPDAGAHRRRSSARPSVRSQARDSRRPCALVARWTPAICVVTAGRPGRSIVSDLRPRRRPTVAGRHSGRT
jgi:hypothetical protein